MSRLILLSDGLNTTIGHKLVKKQLKNENLENKKIYLFYEPNFSIENRLLDSCRSLGFAEENIVLSPYTDAEKVLENIDYVYVTEGNTFEILKIMKERKLLKPICQAVRQGACYIGASAGAMIAGVDIALAADFDKNEVNLQDLRGLGLFDGTIVPHYTKKELKEYIKNSDIELIKKYKKYILLRMERYWFYNFSINIIRIYLT